MKKIAIGFITYNNLTAKYLPYFLNSLKSQILQDFDTIVLDNSEQEENENTSYINNNFDDIEIVWQKENLGFAQGYNFLLDRISEKDYEYVLITNPDMTFEPDAIKKMLAILESDKSISSVAPKILEWDFESNTKTNIIDTCGIIMKKPLRFSDSFQGEEDNGQCDNLEILGPSGACGLFRMSSLEKIKDEHGYFDSRMFMYKEDCDLVYRMHLKKYKSVLAKNAIVYHDRTASAKGDSLISKIKARGAKNVNTKKWSFANQQLLFLKHIDSLSLREKHSVWFYNILLFIYAYIFERVLIKEYRVLKTTLKKN